MTRQNSAPLLLMEGRDEALPLSQVDRGAGPSGVTEADVQALVQAHPELLPIGEIDPTFLHPVAICTELNTPAGSIDNFLVTASGYPVLVECKLWRNPQARREVVGQVLDYAKELARWTSADLEREVSRRGVDSLVGAVRATGVEVDEAAFHDNLSHNLKRGRCLLLIVGDGIREGVEAIFQHLREHAALHFSLGLVELPLYEMPDGGRIVVPRTLARTAVEVRRVVELPEGMALETEAENEFTEADPKKRAEEEEHLVFWSVFVDGLRLDDPEQPIPAPTRYSHMYFMLPAPSGTSWLTVYRSVAARKVGLFLSYQKDTLGERASEAIIENWSELKPQLGGGARLIERSGRRRVDEALQIDNLQSEEGTRVALEWLTRRTNDFVNVLRPAVRAAVAEAEDLDN